MERDQLTKLQDTGLPVAVPLGADLHASTPTSRPCWSAGCRGG